MITHLHVHNYKSIRNLHLDLPPLAAFVGANASGKSNLVDSLDFLASVFQHGLPQAIRQKGGYENICFRRERRSKGGIAFGITAKVKSRARFAVSRKRVVSRPATLETTVVYRYDFEIRARSAAIIADYQVTRERLEVSSEFGDGFTVTRKPDGTFDVRSQGNLEEFTGLFSDEDELSEFFSRLPLSDEELLFPTRFTTFHTMDIRTLLSGCRVYQISPQKARETGVPERNAELGRHGDNLPAAVEYLNRNDPDAFAELESHLRNSVASFERLETDYVETKQLGLFFKETGVGKRWFSQDVSDGTLQTLSVFIPLLDSRVRIAIIEEPENSLHPWILRHFIDACKSAARSKQVILTTHSIVAVNELELNSLFIVTRSKGETSVRPAAAVAAESREVIARQVLGLGEYWDTGALHGVPAPALQE